MNQATSGGDPVIVCKHVNVAYGRDTVLHDVCLEVERGAFLPVVGPNGAGKTTLLRTILGLLKPRSGQIITPFAVSPPGYVSQQKSIDPLYPVSVRHVVGMGLYPRLGWWRRPSAALRDELQHALEQFDLAQHARKTFAELSGGMKQKALIARAFVSGAEVFIMDEPTSELDELAEKEVLSHLHRLSAQEGKTVLLAHHGLDHHVAELAPTVCVVEHGRVSLENTSRATPVRDRSAQAASTFATVRGGDRPCSTIC